MQAVFYEIVCNKEPFKTFSLKIKLFQDFYSNKSYIINLSILKVRIEMFDNALVITLENRASESFYLGSIRYKLKLEFKVREQVKVRSLEGEDSDLLKMMKFIFIIIGFAVASK
jgi:hypothetical protein